MSGGTGRGTSATRDAEGDHFDEVTPSKWGGRRAVVVVGVVLVAILIVLGAVPFAQASPDDRLTLLLTVVCALAFAAIVVVISLTATTRLARGKVARVAAQRPAASVFLSAKTTRVRDCLRAAGVEPRHLPLKFAASLSSQGLELWGRDPADGPRLTLPWPQVEHVGAGFQLVSAGRTVVSARTAIVHFQPANGAGSAAAAHLTLPLTFYSASGTTYAPSARANELLHAFARWTRVGG